MGGILPPEARTVSEREKSSYAAHLCVAWHSSQVQSPGGAYQHERRSRSVKGHGATDLMSTMVHLLSGTTRVRSGAGIGRIGLTGRALFFFARLATGLP
jgi:hypothetical protein